MQKCVCGSDKIVSYSGKVSDTCSTTYRDKEIEGYPVHLTGIAGGDYLDISICLSCKLVQNDFTANDVKRFEQEFTGQWNDLNGDLSDEEIEDSLDDDRDPDSDYPADDDRI